MEHDADFAASLQSLVQGLPNVFLSVVPPSTASGLPGEIHSRRAGFTNFNFEEYVSTINAADGLFDLIVIDGRARSACLKASVNRLAPGGLILFDNSNRSEYLPAIANSGMNLVRYRGLAPALPYPSESAILTHRSA